MAGRPRKKAAEMTELAKLGACIMARLTCTIPAEYWDRHGKAATLSFAVENAREALLEADIDNTIDTSEIPWRLTKPTEQLSEKLRAAVEVYDAAVAASKGADAIVSSDGVTTQIAFVGEKLSDMEIHWRMATELAWELSACLTALADHFRAKVGQQPLGGLEAVEGYANEIVARLNAAPEADSCPADETRIVSDRCPTKTRRPRARARKGSRREASSQSREEQDSVRATAF